jgi:hypothetical protein
LITLFLHRCESEIEERKEEQKGRFARKVPQDPEDLEEQGRKQQQTCGSTILYFSGCVQDQELGIVKSLSLSISLSHPS